MPLEEPIRWHEYEITLYPLPGHCREQVAISTRVDGLHALATGDQQDGGWIPGHRPETLNYQYKNGFRPADYVSSALLYQRIRPDLMLTGHWGVRPVDDAYLDQLLLQGRELVRLHSSLLPRDDVDVGPGDFPMTIVPYMVTSHAGDPIDYQVRVMNPLPEPGIVQVSMVLPAGWGSVPPSRPIDLGARAEGTVAFTVTSPAGAGRARRAVLAADLVVNGRRFGQLAEAFVDLE